LLQPWLVVALLAVSLYILYVILVVMQPYQNLPDVVVLDPAQGAVYNYPPLSPPISAFGKTDGDSTWISDAEEGAIGFTYKTSGKIDLSSDLPAGGPSRSGLYITFYGNPRMRSAYREFSFQCKASGADVLDLGVRIAVDEISAKGGTIKPDAVAYEPPSTIMGYTKSKDGVQRGCASTWQLIKIDLADVHQVATASQPSIGLDRNAINKIVFFIDAKTATQYPSGTLWFRNLAFTR
jgi:hypothetical protein